MYRVKLMIAYKVVREINNKLYSFGATEHNLGSSFVVQYELNKKTTYPRYGLGNNFLYCFKSIEAAQTFASIWKVHTTIKIFKCSIVKSKSKDAQLYLDKHSISSIPASSVTLLEEIPLN